MTLALKSVGVKLPAFEKAATELPGVTLQARPAGPGAVELTVSPQQKMNGEMLVDLDFRLGDVAFRRRVAIVLCAE